LRTYDTSQQSLKAAPFSNLSAEVHSQNYLTEALRL